jgi:hypothetical protein
MEREKELVKLINVLATHVTHGAAIGVDRRERRCGCVLH